MNRRLRELFRSWSSQDEDSRNAFLLVAGIGAVVILALGIIGYGYMKDRSERNGDVVLRVGDSNVSYSYLEKRLGQFMRGDASLSPEQFSAILSGIVAELEQEVLLRHVAETKDIEVTDAELDAEMRTDLGVTADASKEVFATALRRELLTTGLSLDEYERIQRAQVVETKLRAEAATAVPAAAEQVNIRLLEVATQAQALDAKSRLANGESLGLVAGVLSTHSSSSKGGEVGWATRGMFDTKLDDAMFAQAVGTTSDIIETDEGFYIVEVRGKETRPVEESVKSAVVNRSYNQMLKASRDELGSEILMTTGQVNRLANHFRSSLNAGG